MCVSTCSVSIRFVLGDEEGQIMPKNIVLQERNSKFRTLESFSQGSSPLLLRHYCCLPKLFGLGTFLKRLSGKRGS